MKKAVVIFALVAAGWCGLGWLRGSDGPQLSDEQRRVVEARVLAFSFANTRPALFLPALPGDAAESYLRGLELSDGQVPSLLRYDWFHELTDLGKSLPAPLVGELRNEAVQRAADAIVEGARRPTATLRPAIGPNPLAWYRLGQATILVAIDELHRGDAATAVRRALAVQRFANDLSRLSLLNGAIFTGLARDGAAVVRAMVESAHLSANELGEVAAALEVLHRDAVSPIDTLLGESYLLDTLLLEYPEDKVLSDGVGMWKDAIDNNGGDWLRGYAEINGRLQQALEKAAGTTSSFSASADEAVAACNRIIGAEDHFCSKLVSICADRAETEIHLRDAHIAALTRSQAVEGR